MKTLAISLLVLALAGLAFGAAATPTAISTIAVSGTTVTINSTAHGLAVNQGFCIAGSSQTADNVCGVVASSSTNSFIFSMSGLTTCSTSCGTVAPAKRAIVLGVSQPSQGSMTVSYLLWLTTQQPLPGGGTTSWSANAVSAGPSQAERNAIASGYFVEVQRSVNFPSNASTTDMQTYINNDWVMSQQALASNIQPGQWYGFFVDPVGWARQ